MGKRWQLVIVCILLDFCRMASSATPPAVDGLSALPIAAPDPICTNALHCSQENPLLSRIPRDHGSLCC